jgi:hypothetical protein
VCDPDVAEARALDGEDVIERAASSRCSQRRLATWSAVTRSSQTPALQEVSSSPL